MSRKYGFTVKNEKEEQQLTVSDMEIGEIALMDAPGRTDMEYVLRTFDRIVSLEDPNRTWDNIYFLDLEVRRLTNVKLAISHD